MTAPILCKISENLDTGAGQSISAQVRARNC